MKGITIVEHLDTDDSPCIAQGTGGIGPREGCHDFIAGKHHVWYSMVSPAYVHQHEHDHAFGLKHTAWVKGCAHVYASGRYVFAGEVLCTTSKSLGVYDLQGNYLRDAYQPE